MGVMEVTSDGILLKEINPAFTLDDVISATEAPLILSDSLNGKYLLFKIIKTRK